MGDRCERASGEDPLRWLPDDLLDDEERKTVGRIATARIGLDGQLYWPIVEIERAFRE